MATVWCSIYVVVWYERYVLFAQIKAANHRKGAPNKVNEWYQHQKMIDSPKTKKLDRNTNQGKSKKQKKELKPKNGNAGT